MIIIPRVLTSLIRELDDSTACRLALVFAERAIQTCPDELSTTERDISLAYIAAARDLVEGKSDISNLGNAHHAYFSEMDQNTRLSGDVTWAAAMAVRVCCQRQMEDAGIMVKNKFVPSLQDVAKRAQSVAGRCAAASEGEQEDGEDTAIARRARWDEAKWQLLYLIESLPFPGEAGPVA